MGLPLPFVSAYERMFRDAPRFNLPAGSVWNMVDILPDFDASARARGGWSEWAVTNFGGATTYATQLLNLSPSLYWRLGDPPGSGSAADSSGHGHTGTYTGSQAAAILGQPGAPTGDIDTAARFVPYAWVVGESYSPFVVNSQRTFMGWAKGFGPLFGSYNSRDPYEYCNLLDTGGGDVNFSTDGYHVVHWLGAWPSTKSWVHWALTYNDQTKTAELFINGLTQGMRVAGAGYNPTANEPIICGANIDPATKAPSSFSGWLDEFSVFERILNPIEIETVGTGEGISDPPLGIGWANFNGDSQHLVVTGGEYVSVGADQSVVDLGSSPYRTHCSRMVTHQGRLMFCATDGSELITGWDGTSEPPVAAVGSPAGCVDVTVFEDYTVAAGGNKVYFSDAGNPMSWHPDLSYIDVPDEITAIYALRNVILVFCVDAIWRIRGSVPPGNGPPNMILDLLVPNTQGTFDSRSIATYANMACFANDEGIWRTDGATLMNMTEKLGMNQYWLSLVEQLNDGESKLAVAFQHRGYYFISLSCRDAPMNEFLDTLCIDLDRSAIFRMSNMNFFGACNALVAGVDETSVLYQAANGRTAVGSISPIFDPGESGVDANGIAIMPLIETAYLRGYMRLHRRWIESTALQTWRYFYLAYDVDGGQVQVRYSTLQDNETLNYLSFPNWNGSLGKTNGRRRCRVPVQVTANGLALELRLLPTQPLPDWSSFRLWEIEVDFYPRETSRL